MVLPELILGNQLQIERNLVLTCESSRTDSYLSLPDCTVSTIEPVHYYGPALALQDINDLSNLSL